MSTSGFSPSDFTSSFGNTGTTVAAFVATGAGVGAIVLAARWGLNVALGAMKKAGR